jgi:hypothetical protein
MSVIFLNYLDGLNSANTVTFSEVLDGGYSSNIAFDGSIDGEDSNERIEKRISSMVSKHIPEFLKDQNPLFLLFLKYYYQYLEQDFHAQEIIQNLSSYGDIDRTVPSFVNYFIQNYGKKLPASSLVDKKFLLKRLNDLYESKGSVLSFQTLFRILYDDQITVEFPYENVLRPSDGEYVSRFCVGVETLSGNPNNISNRYLTYTYKGAKFDTPIIGTKSLPNGITEIEIKGDQRATDYIPGSNVYIYDKNLNELFVGNILPTITDYSILVEGTNFKKGKFYTVSYGNSTESLIRVNKVDSNKGISGLQIVSFGYNFPNNLQLDLEPDENFLKTVEPKVSSTRGTTDEFSIDLINDSDYFSENYLDTGSNYIGNPILFLYSYDELAETEVFILDNNNVPFYNSTNIKDIRYFANTASISLKSNTLGTSESFTVFKANDLIYFAEVPTNNYIDNNDYYSGVDLISLSISGLVSNATSYANIAGSASNISSFISNTYFETIRSGNILEITSEVIGNVSADVSTISFKTGGLAKYPGSYISSRGFLSESDVNLQDNLLNQPFAYQVVSSLDISKFYDVVLDLVHPAGYLLFNKRIMRNSIDVSANVGSSTREIISKLEVFDSADPSDISFLTWKYDFYDNTESSDNVTLSFNSVLSETLDTIDDTLNIININIGTPINANLFYVTDYFEEIYTEGQDQTSVGADTTDTEDFFDLAFIVARNFDDTVDVNSVSNTSFETSFINSLLDSEDIDYYVAEDYYAQEYDSSISNAVSRTLQTNDSFNITRYFNGNDYTDDASDGPNSYFLDVYTSSSEEVLV